MTKERLLLSVILAHYFGDGIEIFSLEALNNLILAIIIVALEMLLVLSVQAIEFPVGHEVGVVRVPDAADLFILYGRGRPLDASALATAELRLRNLLTELSHQGGETELRIDLYLPRYKGLIVGGLRKAELKERQLHKEDRVED